MLDVSNIDSTSIVTMVKYAIGNMIDRRRIRRPKVVPRAATGFVWQLEICCVKFDFSMLLRLK